VVVKKSTNIKKTINHPLSQLIEHKTKINIYDAGNSSHGL